MKQPLTDGKALEPEAKGSWKSDSFEEKKDALIGWSYLSIQRWKVWEKQELGIKAGGAGVVAIAVEPPKQAELWFGEEGPVTALCLPLGVWAIWDSACFHAVCECTDQVQCWRPIMTSENGQMYFWPMKTISGGCVEDGKVLHQWVTSSFVTSFTLVKNSLVEVKTCLKENLALRFYKNLCKFSLSYDTDASSHTIPVAWGAVRC